MRTPAKTLFLLLAVLATLTRAQTAAEAAAPAKAPSAASSTPAARAKDASYERFKAIAEKNIFNPYRSGRSSKANAVEAAPTGDFIALVGTMSYGKGVFAFFDSNQQAYRKVVAEGGPLEAFSVSHITAQGAQLSLGSQIFSLGVAQQLTRPPEGGDWTLSTAPAANPAQTSAESASGGTEAAQPVPADASDVLKRLMEKRQKQLK